LNDVAKRSFIIETEAFVDMISFKNRKIGKGGGPQNEERKLKNT
jgi:hypothetical protein